MGAVTRAQEMQSALASVTGYAMQAERAFLEWRLMHRACKYECVCGTYRKVHEEAREKLYKAQDEFVARFGGES